MSELLIHMKGKDQFQKKINSNEKNQTQRI